MLEVAEELRELYKTDYLPYRDNPIHKELTLYFPELGLTIENDQFSSESLILTENLCSDEELTFGGCEAAQFEITVADIAQDLRGKEFIATQKVDGRYIMPLGTYVVQSAKKTDDLRFKEILAYDHMLKLDTDVSAWYNGFFSGTGSRTLKEFRLSLFRHIGLDIVQQELTNDLILLSKTIEPTYLSGRDVARSIGEINGVFGHITRENKFKYIDLSSLGLYPSETLYPSEDLYPSEAVDNLGTASYISGRREEYFVRSIDCLQIRQEEGDVGYTHGDGDNLYVIQGNFLVYGKGAEELKTIAYNIFLKIKDKYYLPHTTTTIGLPYLEVGDSVNIFTRTDVVEALIFKRVMTGIQAMRDEYSASGSEYRNNTVSPTTDIRQLQAKTLRIDRSVDGLSAELSDLEKETSAKFELTDERITMEVGDLRKDTASAFEQTANEISLKVSKGDVSSQLSLEPDKVYIRGNRLVIESSNFKLDENGNAVFSGTVSGAKVNSTEIEGGKIKGATIEGAVIQTEYGDEYVRIQDGTITCTRIALVTKIGGIIGAIPVGVFYYSGGKSTLLCSEVSCGTVNGSTPLLDCSNSGSDNTVISISKSGNNVVAHKGFRCTFSGVSESDTPNARVSGGGNVAQAASSSMRYKEGIKPVEDEDLNVKNLYKINVKQFKYREGYLKESDRRNGKNTVGFIVEQIDRYYPIAVDYNEEGFPEMWNSNIMIPAMFGLIKEQKAEIDELRSELHELKELLKTKGVI